MRVTHKNHRIIALLLAIVGGLVVAAEGSACVARSLSPQLDEAWIVVRPYVDDAGRLGGVEWGLRARRTNVQQGESNEPDRSFLGRRFFSQDRLIQSAGTWLSSRAQVSTTLWGDYRSIDGWILARPELHDDGHLARIEFGFRPIWGLQAPEQHIGPDDIFPPKRFLTRSLVDQSAGNWIRIGLISISSGSLCSQPDEWCGPVGELTSVSAGAYHSCAVSRGGGVTCWGMNSSRQTAAPRGAFDNVTAGSEHTCGLRKTGHIQCWGNNRAGQTAAPWGLFLEVSAGGSHTCGLREEHVIECWGSNEHGQSDAPSGRFTAVSAGAAHSCGVREGGQVECWGSNAAGQSTVPHGHFNTVSASWLHTCGLLNTGEARCWGLNSAGSTNTPPGTFKSISAGAVYSCGVRDGGTAECWGWNDYGQADVTFPASSAFKSISAGGVHVCGTIESTFRLRSYDGVVCWGGDDWGQVDIPFSQEHDDWPEHNDWRLS